MLTGESWYLVNVQHSKSKTVGNTENMVMARVGVVGAKCAETVLESQKH